MRFQRAAILSFAGSALGSPTKHSVPCINSLGSVQVLHYNNLGPQNNGTSAVLVYDDLSHKDAAARCAEIGEELHPWSSTVSLQQTQLLYELDYLTFSNELRADALIWVSTEPVHGKQCLALSISHKKLLDIPCNVRLHSLCSSTPPPSTDLDRRPRESSKLTIESQGYSMTGYRDARSFRFLGIPFANPPTGHLRFAPPQAYSGPEVIDATTLSDSCIQSMSNFGTKGNGGISEDCLYLNVYTPVLPSSRGQRTALRPVAVYLYGGAFTKGSAAMIDYDGGNFASRSDVIIVTLNYRVGALGYLSTGDLTTGSYGTRDQIMALEWVQRHIKDFGGDPSHVTLFGQSAGGQSTVALLSSSAAKGLFSGALVQSAPLDSPWFPRKLYSKYIAPAVAQAVGCNGTSSEQALLKCLRAVPATSYLDNSTAFGEATASITASIADHYYHNTKMLSGTEPFMPMVDDLGSGVIDDQFFELLAKNKLPVHVPTMFTNVRDEAALYTDGEVSNLGSSQLALDALLQLAFGAELAPKMISSGAFQVNTSDPDGVRNAASDAVTASEWTCAQGYLLNQTHSAFPALYEVVITNGHMQTNVGVPAICSPNNDYNASCHSSDVLLAWGTLNSKTKNVAPYYDDQDVRHSQLLHDVFGAFFRTRNPNPDLDFLKVRGPAYATTLAIFAGGQVINPSHGEKHNGLSIEQYQPQDRNLTLLGFPPSHIANFEYSDMCAVFHDYGFTFQRAGFTN
ncbi:Carboxylesterase type B [Penicillium sp. IBT 18751x]|nr:Carboxylesterase type B [Penicillium sp. IBT 18751x]